MDRFSDAVWRLRSVVGMGSDEDLADEEVSFLPSEDLNPTCTLTAKQRAYGFVACFTLGLFCSILSTLVFLRPLKFAVTYTVGNLLSLGSTGFFVGPRKQLKMMFDPIRRVSTIIYLFSIFLALYCALHLHSRLLTLFAIIVEGSCLVWYTLSYVPFAQAAVRRWTLSLF